MFQQPPDHESWFKAFLEGDPKACRYFSDYYAGHLKKFIQGKVKDAQVADELTSDTIIQAWDIRAILNSPKDLPVILYITADFAASNYLREGKRIKLDPYLLRLLYYQNESTDAERVKANVIEQIHLRAEKLPEKQKKVYDLCFKEGLSNDEIAQRLGISPHTVRNHLAKIIKYLKNFVYIEHLILFVILVTAIKIF